MEKRTELREVIHLYWGCEVSVTNLECRYTTFIDHEFYNSFFNEDDGTFLNDPKPILRRLSSMTEEEESQMFEETGDCANFGKFRMHICETAVRTKWLLSKSFDLFNLIDSGQAIEQTPEK